MNGIATKKIMVKKGQSIEASLRDNGVFAALNVPPGYGIVTIKGALKVE